MTCANGYVIFYLDPSFTLNYVMVRPPIKEILVKCVLHLEELLAQNLQQSDFP